MSKKLTCPNCLAPVANHPDTACVLGALIALIRDRQSVPERRLRKIHADTDVDAMWEDIGPVIDKLEAGGYSLPDNG